MNWIIYFSNAKLVSCTSDIYYRCINSCHPFSPVGLRSAAGITIIDSKCRTSAGMTIKDQYMHIKNEI
jgi:hypothetical protein